MCRVQGVWLPSLGCPAVRDGALPVGGLIAGLGNPGGEGVLLPKGGKTSPLLLGAGDARRSKIGQIGGCSPPRPGDFDHGPQRILAMICLGTRRWIRGMSS